MATLHKDLKLADNHPIHSFQVSDASALQSLAVTAADIGKVALRASDASYWVLSSLAPRVWTQLGGLSGASGGTASQQLRLSASLYEVFCTPAGQLVTEVYLYRLKSPDGTIWGVTVDASGVLNTVAAAYGYGTGANAVEVPGTDGSRWQITVDNGGVLNPARISG